MNLSSSVIRIFILVLPGIISALLYWRLRGRTGRKDWEDFLEIGVFSFGAYVTYSLGISLLNYVILDRFFGFHVLPPKALDALAKDSLPIPWAEVPEATAIGVVLAMAAAYADKHNLVGRVGFRIGASTRLYHGEVWDTFLKQPEMGWVYVRDHKVNRVYYGWLFQFSDADQARELVLRDVKVYEGDEFLYASPQLYISREKHELTIEFVPDAPATELTNNHKEIQVNDNQNQGPAVKIINPPSAPPGSGQKSNQNPNPQTPRPAAEPVSQQKPRTGGKKQ